MKIKAYPLYDHAVAMQLTPAAWNRVGKNAPLSTNLSLPGASGLGWDLLCPATFTATWNGGPRPKDIDIRLEGAITIGEPAFVQSQLGDGLLTFYPGYQFKTEGDHLLWLRGPLNVTKDGLAPLESLVDAALLPCTVALHWQFTRPHQTIRFEAGEPFATFFAYPRAPLERMNVEVMQHESDAATYERAFAQMTDSPTLRDLFQRLGATPAAPHAPDAKPTPGAKAAPATESLPAGCFDTIDGRLDLEQFESDFFLPERFFGSLQENILRHHGEIHVRTFYLLDELKLAYLSIPKVACTAIKLALAKVSGITFEPDQNIEYVVHIHPQWRRVMDRLHPTQSDYYRFTFVRNPFDRLVSCYRSKIIIHPHYGNYFFALPTKISFADFAERVSKIPDALADPHFKSQHPFLYRKGELQVDYIGKFEQLDHDWQPLAARYQLDPTLAPAYVSKGKAGCPSDYRLYYTEPLVHLVYERYRKDIEVFGYQEEYEQLLTSVRHHQQTAVPGVSEGERHTEKELNRYEC